MAIDERFHLDQFLRIRGDADALEAVNAELEKEVHKRLHEVVQPAVEEIVARLNGVGHNLTLYYEPVPGDIGYRDDQTVDGRYSCKLRLGVDVVVSIGFADTVDEEPA